MSSRIKTPLLIVGGGAAGLTAAIYASRARLSPVVLAGTSLPGGQLMLAHDVENYPGFAQPIQGPQLMEDMKVQAQRVGAQIVNQTAAKVNRLSKHQFEISTTCGTVYQSNAVILAMGALARWLELPNEPEYIGRGVSACATCDGPLPKFADQHIAVVGGGDTACTEALFLTHFAHTVTLIHRRDQLRASKVLQDRVLNHPKIRVEWSHIVTTYHGTEALEGITLLHTPTRRSKVLKVKGCFLAIGHSPATEWLNDSPVQMDKDGYIHVHQFVHTNVPGVFAAGDCSDNVYRQAVTAAGFGCMASMEAERYLVEYEE